MRSTRCARTVAFLFLMILYGGTPVRAEPGSDHGDHDAAVSSSQNFSPQFTLHGFSDVTFRVWNSKETDEMMTGFELGQFDLYFISRLGDNFSFLGETVFELGEDGEIVTDVERVFLKYTRSDLLRFTVGRTHTALGYWNEAFHHGALLQPTVERPEALKFEDDGGLLPVHSVGVEVGGEARFGDWACGYVGNLANGRGPTRDGIQGTSDMNQDKALSLKLTLQHYGEHRLAFGPAIYRDLIPPDAGVVGREAEMREVIPGAHIYYHGPKVDVLAEVYEIRHKVLPSGTSYAHKTGYVVVTYSTALCKPYAGIEAIDYEPGDMYFDGNDTDLTRITAGLRFEPSPFTAIKVEFREDHLAGEKIHGVLAQTAFTF